MPLYRSAHVFASQAITHYLANYALTDNPDETICSECLFFAWFDREPCDPPDVKEEFSHYRTGSRDSAWNDLVQLAVFKQALEIMKIGIRSAYERKVKGVA